MKTITKKRQNLIRFIILAGLFLTTESLKSQDCTCITNSDLTSISAPGDMNTSSSLTIQNWQVSHGNPTIFVEDAPGGSNNRSIWMWAASGIGEGVHTCYNFQNGKTYEICFWVKNNGNFGNGSMVVAAANGLPNYTPPANNVNYAPPTPTSQQTIASSQNSFLNWTQVSYRFTANANYSRLWISPRRGNGTFIPPRFQLEMQIDRVVVNEVSPLLNGAGITASANTINWCGSSVLTVSNIPVGAVVIWQPAPGLTTTTGSTATVSPCATTTYTATVIYPNELCDVCPLGGQVLTKTIIVNPPTLSINGNTQLSCGNTLNLSASPILSCNNYIYEWRGPNGFTTFGSAFSIPNITEQYAGTYTLTVSNSQLSLCAVTATVNVVLSNCPCSALPDFTNSGCNPVQFTGTNTGGTNVISWLWDFGDGSTSNLASPTHTFITATPRTYTVCLTITARNLAGQTCTGQICKPVSVCATPPSEVNCEVQSYYLDGGGYDFTAYFYENIYITQGTLCQYVWDFGDGQTAYNTPAPSHTYSQSGTYNVCLTATSCVNDPWGNTITSCFDLYCRTITVGGVSWRQGSMRSESGSEIYPNPANTETVITPQNTGAMNVAITDAQGRIVKTTNFNGDLSVTLDISDLASGIYLVQINYADGTATRQKLIKE
jgi:Secretion system C-terminal sorting domain/PKD domain